MILRYELCLDIMKIVVIKTSDAIRLEIMGFESRTSMFQKKRKVRHETKRYEMIADLLEFKDASLDYRGFLRIY